MARKILERDEVLELLNTTPARIEALVAGLTPKQLRTRPAEDEWSAVELLAHLRSCADVWGECIRTILVEDHPTIRAIDPRSWTPRTDYPDLEFAPSWEAFKLQRAALLGVLETVSPEQWERTATVTGAGRPLERTARFYAAWLARHERSHVKQFKQIADAVRAD